VFVKLQVPRIDYYLGINAYATNIKGIGGTLKNFIDDFIVEEVLVDGSTAKVSQRPSNQVLSASQKKQRFLLCVFTKRNWDFFSALKNISRQLGIIETKIGFAGIKDAKAITSQFITIDHFLKKEIKSLKLKDINLYPLGYFREHLSAYYLLGNKFTITIRQLEQSFSEVEKSINKIIGELNKIGGFPNYFGYQRFGTVRPITHLVGKAVIEDNFEKAIKIFLMDYSDSEHPTSRQARKNLCEKQDYERSLKEFPKHLRFERLILSHLVKKPNDYIGAFKRFPIRLQMLFVQAYQSYLFNLFLSERLKVDNTRKKAVIGDYVVNIERSGLPMTQMGKLVEVHNQNEINKLIELGKMRLALPLVGTKQNFSCGLSGETQKKVLEKEGIKPEAFYIKKIPRISSRGILRTIFTPLKDFEIINTKNTENKLNLKLMLLLVSYATIFLREIMKPANPITAGF
jgi:tRNA pseudouridine13 synthase